jgi:hypothetical protein
MLNGFPSSSTAKVKRFLRFPSLETFRSRWMIPGASRFRESARVDHVQEQVPPWLSQRGSQGTPWPCTRVSVIWSISLPCEVDRVQNLKLHTTNLFNTSDSVDIHGISMLFWKEWVMKASVCVALSSPTSYWREEDSIIRLGDEYWFFNGSRISTLTSPWTLVLSPRIYFS